jgi:hypothetical protein
MLLLLPHSSLGQTNCKRGDQSPVFLRLVLSLILCVVPFKVLFAPVLCVVPFKVVFAPVLCVIPFKVVVPIKCAVPFKVVFVPHCVCVVPKLSLFTVLEIQSVPYGKHCLGCNNLIVNA